VLKLLPPDYTIHHVALDKSFLLSVLQSHVLQSIVVNLDK
jgi:hypothetical protein